MRDDTRRLVITAVLAAVSTVLMFLSFSVPLMPSYIKMDFSELPALIAACFVGPWSGAAVVVVKNLVNLPFSTTFCVGELCNVLLGLAFVLPAGFIGRRSRRSRVMLAGLTGAVCMAAVSLAVNYYISYPLYSVLLIPMDVIMGMYRTILPSVETLWEALLIFNAPFTLVKGLVSVALITLLYRPLKAATGL